MPKINYKVYGIYVSITSNTYLSKPQSCNRANAWKAFTLSATKA